MTEITHGALICKKSVDVPPYIRGYRKTSANQTFCFTKDDLPNTNPNATTTKYHYNHYPIPPPEPPASSGSENGAEDHNRKKRQSKYSVVDKIKPEISMNENVLVISEKTHTEIFSFGRNPERWLTKNPNYNYTCDLARLIVWKDGGNEFAKLSQERYQNVTASTKAGKYYGLRYEDCEFGVDFPLCGEWT